MADEATTQTEDTGTTLEGAAEALGKAREAAEDGNRQPEASAGADTATPETPDTETPDGEAPTGDDTEAPDEVDSPELTVQTPATWTKEAKEWFKTLPPERQADILRYEKSAQAELSRKQSEIAAERQRYEQEAQAAAQERQYFQSQLQHYKHPVEAAFRQQFADVLSGQMDLFRLSQDPQRWPAYQAFQAEFARIGQAEMMLAQRAEQEEQVRLQKHIETRNAKLFEAMPDLKDQAKFEKFDADITAYLRNYNVPDDRIAKISYEELDIVHKAMKWDAAQKARANVPRQPQAGPGQKVIPSHVRTLPKVLKPGTPNNAGAHDEKIAATRQQLRKSGSVDDAAALLRTLRSQLSA